MAGAKYRQIADNLREQISSGTLRPGEQLPPEPRLAESFDASRSTIRLAIGMLATNGLIETRQGMGTFVSQPAAPRTVLLTREEDWQAGEHTDAALQPTGENTDKPVTASAVPVTVVRRIAYDASRPIRLTMYVYRADQVRLRHEMGNIPHGQ